MSLSSELNGIVKQLQLCRIALGEATEHVQYQSDDYAQLLLWQSDLEFVELLIAMWMSDHKLDRERGTSIKHINRQPHTKVYHIPESLLNDEWIGSKK